MCSLCQAFISVNMVSDVSMKQVILLRLNASQGLQKYGSVMLLIFMRPMAYSPELGEKRTTATKKKPKTKQNLTWKVAVFSLNGQHIFLLVTVLIRKVTALTDSRLRCHQHLQQESLGLCVWCSVCSVSVSFLILKKDMKPLWKDTQMFVHKM